MLAGRRVPGANSRPYKSLATGHATAADALTHASAPSRGVHETLLRNHEGTATLATDQAEARMLEPLPPRDQEPD